VLAVDQTSSTNKDDPVIVRAVTLEMTQEEAEKLVKATNNGNVQLTLRNPLDTEVVAEKIPEPKPRPRPRPKAKSEPPKPTVPQVTVIKGSKVSTTAVGM
jgi:pilus assembly protein CpaB